MWKEALENWLIADRYCDVRDDVIFQSDEITWLFSSEKYILVCLFVRHLYITDFLTSNPLAVYKTHTEWLKQ